LLYFANNNFKGYFDMSKLPVISGAECIKALEKIGFVVNRQRGSHITLVRQEPLTQLTVPNHKTIAKGTLRTIIRDSGLTVDEFVYLL
jgi:predicted RNA binding protein YcfA (HicA-like mRNA interferase family)